MKISNILMTGALALVSMASANAAMPYTSGDLILGIYDTTASQTLEFNLGSYSSYSTEGKRGFVVNIGDEMTAIYGATWYNNTNIKWGLAGVLAYTVGNNGTMQVAFGIPEATFGTVNTSLFTKFSLSSSTATSAGQVTNYGLAFAAATPYGDGALINQTVSGEIKDYDLASSDFNTGKNIISTLGTASGVTDVKALDLFSYMGSTNGVYQNTSFTIDNSGNIMAVPEPSTYALLIGGLGTLALLRRRTAANA